MKKRYSPFLLLFLCIAVVQMACNLPSGAATPDTFATLNGLYTMSALTGQVQATATVTPGLPQPTLTTIPALIPTSSAPRATAVTARCDAAKFESDVTYADGSVLSHGAPFVKIWRIRNVGTCSWTTSYALVFTGGDLMNGPLVSALTKNVNPGETVDLQVGFVAPSKNGNYRSYWKLRNASGAMFGIGDNADTPFWVDVNVTGKSFAAYAFARNACKANWENNNTALPCPGTPGDPRGFAVIVDKPVIENGATQDDPAILVSPKDSNNGIISGTFPGFTVQAGDRFRTMIGCQYGSEKCNVSFQIDYEVNGKLRTLGTWYEIYEGLSYPIDIDLTPLAGKTVSFILTVGANGGNREDNAFWLNPHISRQGTPPTRVPTTAPTFTFTPSATPTATFTPSATPTFTETPSETPTP